MSNQVEVAKLLKTNSELSVAQIQKFFSETPKDKIKSRPAKGGGDWDYVAGSYVTQVLNSLFAFDWNFTITTSMQEALDAALKTGSVVVQGRLEVRVGDRYIVKEQYGRKEVAFKKGTKEPLDFGNDMKAAATDAKKKCASELGLFADVYAQEDFFEAQVVEQVEPSLVDKFREASTEEEIQNLMQTVPADELQAYTPVAKRRLEELRNGNSNRD